MSAPAPEPSLPQPAPAPAGPAPLADPPASAPTPNAPPLTAEEQMERFAQALKEDDWGHQPC